MAAEGIETAASPMPVSVRTFLATPNDRVIKVFRIGPVTPWARATSYAALT